MSANDLDNDYEVDLKANEERIKYESVKKLPILLKGHVELPQEYRFSHPKLSKEGKYLTAIGKSKNEKDVDIVYIWNAKHLDKKRILELKGVSKIEIVDFSPDENIFVIVYKDLPPVFFDFNLGKEISTCEDKKIKHNKIFSYAFSNKGKNFAIATDTDFVAYNIKTGKIKRKIISDSPIKVFRGKKAVFIDETFKTTVIDVKEGKNIKDFNLTAIGGLDNILSTMMSPDGNFIYYMKNDGVDTEKLDKVNYNGHEWYVVSHGEFRLYTKYNNDVYKIRFSVLTDGSNMVSTLKRVIPKSLIFE